MSLIDTLKHRLSGAAVLAHFLGPSGKPTRWHCPWHDDRHPSMSAKGNVITCFAGCFQGDVIDFTSEYLKITTREAIHILSGLAGISADPMCGPAQPRRIISQIRRANQRDLIRLCQKAAGIAWRLAYQHRFTHTVWDLVDLGSTFDRYTEIIYCRRREGDDTDAT